MRLERRYFAWLRRSSMSRLMLGMSMGSALKRAASICLNCNRSSISSHSRCGIIDRLMLLAQHLETINHMAAANDLPDAIITDSGLKITPLDAAVPDLAQALIDQTAMLLPHIKITELLLEVDKWTNFTRHFTHLKTGDMAKDKTLLLTTILADAINLGLTKMAESCSGMTYAKLSGCKAGTSAMRPTQGR